MSSGVESGVPKDVFVVHSKRDKAHAALADLLGATLASVGCSLWEYEDWDWEARRRGAIRHHWSGRVDQLDPARYMAGEAPFRRRQEYTEIDREALDDLLMTSRALVLLAPASGRLSAGSLVEVERIAALIGREGGPSGVPGRPIIIEAGWTDEPLPEFAPLSPSLFLMLSKDPRDDAARLTAASASAWMVYTLQTIYGVPGQHLLSCVSSEDKLLDRLVTRSPNYRSLDFDALEERSRGRRREESPPPREARWEASAPGMISMPDPDDIGELLLQMDLATASVLGRERFSVWLETEVAPVRAWVDAQDDGGREVEAARTLLRGVTANWEGSFERFELAELPLERGRGAQS